MNGRMTRLRRVLAVVIAAAALVALAMPAAAQHRARLSGDLAAELGSPTRAAVPVIVQGDAAALQALAARHGLRVRKVLEAGVVLEGSAGQLDAAAADPAFAHMSLDAEVKGQMAVTREAIGATLVYGNFVRPDGFTGRNVGIAVIDSGIDPAYQGLDGRLVVSKDFTGTGSGDEHLHGLGSRGMALDFFLNLRSQLVKLNTPKPAEGLGALISQAIDAVTEGRLLAPQFALDLYHAVGRVALVTETAVTLDWWFNGVRDFNTERATIFRPAIVNAWALRRAEREAERGLE